MGNKNKLTVTIGIPAFNEEANIGNLLNLLKEQEQKDYILKKVIVASDGSNDNTVKIASSFDLPGLLVLENYFRKGAPYRQNQIISYTDTDILVLLNADLLPQDSLFIEKLVRPIIDRKSDLTSVRLREIPPQNFIEETIAVSNIFKNYLFENINQGNNIYTCKGIARAFSKRLYNKIDFKQFTAEDAHSYLFAKKFGFKYQYAKDAVAIFKLPKNIEDHLRQSQRFFQARDELVSEYGYQFVKNHYSIPVAPALKAFLRIFAQYPLHTFFYLYILAISKIKAKIKPYVFNKGIWQISSSTKYLDYPP